MHCVQRTAIILRGSTQKRETSAKRGRSPGRLCLRGFIYSSRFGNGIVYTFTLLSNTSRKSTEGEGRGRAKGKANGGQREGRGARAICHTCKLLACSLHGYIILGGLDPGVSRAKQNDSNRLAVVGHRCADLFNLEAGDVERSQIDVPCMDQSSELPSRTQSKP